MFSIFSRISGIRDVVTEMSVTNESAIASPVSATRCIHLPRLQSAGSQTQTPLGDAPETHRSDGFSLIQSEDIRKSLRYMEKHVCTAAYGTINTLYSCSNPTLCTYGYEPLSGCEYLLFLSNKFLPLTIKENCVM